MNNAQHSSWNLDTQLVQGGRQRCTDTQDAPVSTVQPIYASTTYLHPNSESLDQAFMRVSAGEQGAHVYARQGNPNAQTLESVLALAEGGVGAVVFGSGMAAIHAALLATGLAAGSKILAAQDLYGQTITLLRQLLVPFGIELVLSDLCAPEVGATIRAEQPDVIYVEALSNPLVKLVDLDAISAAAREVGAVTLIDSTFATPYLLKPLEHGFDLVIHSTTKYFGGHGDTTGGVVISSSQKLLRMLQGYSPLLGAMLSPFESYLTLRGLKTLGLRMERQCDNALRVASFLEQHPAVARVYYPGLASHPQHALANQLLSQQRYGGLLSFELQAQSREAAFRVMDRLCLCLPATTLGDVYTLITYPPISSHRSLTPKELELLGITAGCLRLSVGIEYIDDILSDLDQALGAAS